MEAFNKVEVRQGWSELFRYIHRTTSLHPYQCKVARKRENVIRNRYGDVNPFDHSRVHLKAGVNDYINSSLLAIEPANRRYILSQGPLDNTSGHMWQMIWEQNSKAVIMLNKIIEKGAYKCFQYWPPKVDETLVFSNVGFTVTLIAEEKHNDFMIRELLLKNINSAEVEERTIFQFHYTTWPDFGVPESPDAFLQFMFCIQECGVLENTVGPAVIHCSAGIGRTGTFALVELCSQYLNKGIAFDATEQLVEMRRFRMGLIQTPEQLRFSFLAIAHFEEQIRDAQMRSSPVVHQATHHDDTASSTTNTPHDNEPRKRLVANTATTSDQKKAKMMESSDQPSLSSGPSNAQISSDDDKHPSSVSSDDEQQARKLRYLQKNEALRKRVEDVKRSMKANEVKSTGGGWKRRQKMRSKKAKAIVDTTESHPTTNGTQTI